VTPQEGLAWFARLSPSHIKMGLDRVQRALERLGHPERRFPAVHVAGTNGKGSTCAIIASCLRQRYRTALYTSPHLIRPNERIQIDGVEIDDDTFGRRIVEVLERLGPEHELTYFEFGTLVAFWHFAEERVDVAVLETGLGGRLDATTACMPLVTCITPIDFDHMEYLGTTLEAIAHEKAGIAKLGVPMVLSREAAQHLPHLSDAIVEGRDFTFAPDDFRLGLKGAHQRQNLALALACLRQLRAFPLGDAELHSGVAAARWPGRLEEFSELTPLVVLDGAHNPSGARVLADALQHEYAGRPVHLVFGVFADKDSEPMMRTLFPKVAALYLAPIDSPRSKPPETYEAFARTLNRQVSTYASAEAALAAAQQAAPENGLVVVAGSLFLVGQLRRTLVDSGRAAVTLPSS